MLDNERFGNRLVKAGVITQDQLDEALHHQELQEGRLGEILVRLGYVSESTILQFLAAEFRTRYVSTERLARARIPQQVLDLLPVHLAERYNLIPVLYDAETSTLSIVTSEPQNEENLRDVHMLTSVRELRVYVALQPAVQAAIRKHYRGEINAFKDLLYQNASPLPNHNEAGYNPSDVHGNNSGYDGMYDPNQYAPQHNDPHGHNYNYHMGNASHGYDQNYNPNGYDQNANTNNYSYPETYDPNQYNYNDPNNYGSAYSGNDTGYGGPAAYQDDYDLDSEKTRLHVNFDYNQSDNANKVAGPSSDSLTSASSANVLGLTQLLVSRLEALHPRYKTHLETQRPLLQATLRRLEYTHVECQPIWLAFYLHHSDLPEPHPTLLTLLNDPKSVDTCKAAHRSFMQRMTHLQLPEETLDILQHMYERADGAGFPNGLLREEIPLGARLLSILDAYEQLHFESPTQANADKVKQLRDQQSTLFDSRLLDFFEQELQRVEQYKQGKIPKVLLLEPEIETAQELERILWEKGFWIYSVSHPSEAEDICKRESIDLMVLEVTLPGDRDGFEFAEDLRKHNPQAPELTYLTSRNNAEDLDRGIELARDYLLKSMPATVLAAKINKQIQQIIKEKAQRSKSANPNQLSGSLEQLGLADLLQFLSQGRRTGRLSIDNNGTTGHIYLDQGAVINASVNSDGGEQALYVLMSWDKGQFTLDPTPTEQERVIFKSTDGLLLDLLRMLDEARRDGVDDPFANMKDDPETSFSGLADDDDDEPAPSGGSGKGGLFGDIQEGDLDDMFSGSFGDPSQNAAKKP
jgi:response regulator RpfG family c-di-GMP phosphodiesterase